MKYANQNLTLRFMIICSLFGSLVVLLIGVYPHALIQDYFWRKPLIGSIFFVICAGGSFVAISPRNCSKTHEMQMARTSRDSNIRTGSAISSEGHHPNCGRFASHTIRFRTTFYCAACTGLFIGGIAAIMTTLMHFFFGFNSDVLGFPAIVAGELSLSLGLIQFKLAGWIRFAANLWFVLGASLMLIGIDQLVSNVFVDLFAIGLVVLWILTRIMISQWHHHEICSRCGFSCRTKRKVVLLASSTHTINSADDY